MQECKETYHLMLLSALFQQKESVSAMSLATKMLETKGVARIFEGGGGFYYIDAHEPCMKILAMPMHIYLWQ